jgi:tetrahydromethanopterin S-methyltransferase subunit C
MKAKVALPLLAVTAIIAGIAGIASGLFFLVAFAVIGLLAAIIGAVWTARKMNRSSQNLS